MSKKCVLSHVRMHTNSSFGGCRKKKVDDLMPLPPFSSSILRRAEGETLSLFAPPATSP